MTRSVTLAGYAALVAMMITLEIVARRTGRVVPFGRAVGLLTGKPALRVVVLAGWLWLGWHLFVRVHR
jgi:Family of unknown function (DUF6186)